MGWAAGGRGDEDPLQRMIRTPLSICSHRKRVLSSIFLLHQLEAPAERLLLDGQLQPFSRHAYSFDQVLRMFHLVFY